MHEYESEIKCPYCDYTFSDSWEISDSTDELECSNCEKEFNLEINHEVTYSTYKKECKNKHKFIHDLYFISDREFTKDFKWIPKLEKDWEYYEVQVCQKCEKNNHIKITKEQYEEYTRKL